MKSKLSVIVFFLIVAGYIFLYRNTGVEKQLEKEEELVSQQVVVLVEEEKPKEVTKADKIIAIAKEHLNVPYKAGGTTKKGFDCSGLIMISFKKEGVALPRASYQMATKGKDVDLKDVRKGDLVFFNTNKQKPKKVSHVGLVTSVDDGVVHFIHSTNKKGVIISRIDEEYYKKSFCKAKRFL